MIGSDQNYPITGADLHWLIRTVEDAHRVPLDTEEMRYAAWQREQERQRNTVTGPSPDVQAQKDAWAMLALACVAMVCLTLMGLALAGGAR